MPLRAHDAGQFCYLTTTGRITGRPHEIEIWFAFPPDPASTTLYLMAGGRERSDWVKNLLQNPPSPCASPNPPGPAPRASSPLKSTKTPSPATSSAPNTKTGTKANPSATGAKPPYP